MYDMRGKVFSHFFGSRCRLLCSSNVLSSSSPLLTVERGFLLSHARYQKKDHFLVIEGTHCFSSPQNSKGSWSATRDPLTLFKSCSLKYYLEICLLLVSPTLLCPSSLNSVRDINAQQRFFKKKAKAILRKRVFLVPCDIQ